MSLIFDLFRAEREFGGVLTCLDTELSAAHPLPILINGLSGGALYAFTGAIAEEVRERKRPLLLLVGDDRTGERFAAVLREGGLRAALYPTRDLVFHNVTASHDTERERLSVLHALAEGTLDAVVATPMAALQYTLPRARLSSLARTLTPGATLSPEALCELLEALGYVHIDAVESAGQYARRGGIVDLFTTQSGAPVRVEFFGNEIDGMRCFDPLTQRTTEPCASLSLLPSREVLPDSAARERIAAAVAAALKKAPTPEAKATLAAEAAALSGGGELRFADKYLSLIYPEKETLFSYLSAHGRAVILLNGTTAVREQLSGARDLLSASVLSLIEAGVLSPTVAEYHASEATFEALLAENSVLHLNSFAGGVSGLRSAGLFGFRTRSGVSYADKLDLLTEDLSALTSGGFRVLLLCTGGAEEAALGERLRGEGYAVAALPPDGSRTALAGGEKCIFTTHGAFPGGFELLTSRVALLSLLTAEELARRKKQSTRRKKQAAGERLLSYAELHEGDYVVHAVHGIGRFGGMTTLTVDGTVRDYITIQYAGADKLFLPADRLEMISKYIGTETESGKLKLSRLGGTEWQRTTAKARASAKDMAKDLINLYAARMRRPGYAFPPDDDMQRAFEEAFPYEETDSQLQAAEEIRADMQKPTPMDRLLCGDVGYGKTEVALRAAFRAIADGKQVALLVPTTILALQHYETALARMRGFPVTVEMLSRFRTPKQQESILRRLKRGEIDLLIGTHKLLGKTVQFRALGLLIVDEEQRFGVAQKEKLKEMAGNVDVLTLTATPIPRTLSMAMSGIRDMSLLDEAPGERHPVQTYVLAHDDLVIEEAIRRELRRGGQVIYLYNRVESIAAVGAKLSRALPDARIVVAHGKMERDELEDIWQALVRGEIDVIVCTTIVETGVDLPNANTLIIEDADRLGLSQLHQLRGRVGRSSRHAYAYFTYRPGKVLSEVAEKRLAAIREYASFGAGFKLALRDLEIRGAGNLLGAEQHGHIEAVGYDMFIRLLNEAILEEQGKAPKETAVESVIDIRASANLPERYIPSAAARMEAYKKISLICEEADRQELLEELCDRYGKPPREVLRLLDVALCRALASRLGLPRIEQRGEELRFVLAEVALPVWSVLFSERKDLRFNRTPPPTVTCRLAEGAEPTETARIILTRYAEVAAEENRTDKESKKA